MSQQPFQLHHFMDVEQGWEQLQPYRPKGKHFNDGQDGASSDFRSSYVYPHHGNREGYYIGMALTDVYDDNGSSRNDFVRVVFMILTIMLAITMLCIMLCIVIEPLNEIMYRNILLSGIGSMLYLVSSLALSCCPFATRSPWNWIFLIMSLVGMTLIACVLCATINKWLVMMAFGITFALCVFLSALACSSFDFTRFLLYVVVLGFVLMLLVLAFMLLCVLSTYIKPLHMVILALGILFNSMMFVIELQMVLGGRALELDVDEYVYGAWCLYTSIMQIFINILRMLDLLECLDDMD